MSSSTRSSIAPPVEKDQADEKVRMERGGSCQSQSFWLGAVYLLVSFLCSLWQGASGVHSAQLPSRAAAPHSVGWLQAGATRSSTEGSQQL